jgi:siderophore synthetase component/RimJ/RimL family protein N-acetyltransferase
VNRPLDTNAQSDEHPSPAPRPARITVQHPAALVLFRAFDLATDIDLILPWVTSPHAKYWGLSGATRRRVEEAYKDICQRARVFIGTVEGSTSEKYAGNFLVETYDPNCEEVGKHYEVQPGDRGMHVLLAPPTTSQSGFSRLVFQSVLDFLFLDPLVQRVVVEPDIRNEKIHRLNRNAGFIYQRPLQLSSKVAHLAFLTRARHESKTEDNEKSPLCHLSSANWQRANDWLVAKAIAEFTHERLLFPTPVSDADRRRRTSYWLRAPGCTRTYTFDAQEFALDHLQVVKDSLRVDDTGAPHPVDLLQFVIDFRDQLNLGANVLPVYLEELTNTLSVMAFKFEHQTATAADLVHADFQEIERAMLEGHPCFIANSGRVGFDAYDQSSFTPECYMSMTLEWVAVHRNRAHVSTVQTLSYEQLMASELDETTRDHFTRTLMDLGLNPKNYLWMPLHPWQWSNKLRMTFASDIACHDIVHLGRSTDSYQAQQSVRTAFNRSAPRKRYVKMALSVLNMGFMRGLSADYLHGTPAINDWVASQLEPDPELMARGFRLLKEVAGIGYRQPEFDRLEKTSPYRKMLATLWRESPLDQSRTGERLMTFAALLHRDAEGVALLPQLVLASGLEPTDWLRRLLEVYLVPIAHCMFAHELAFMPHGENLILILENNAPVGVYLKDIAEEVVLMSHLDVPQDVERIRVHVPTRLKALGIHTDLFDCFMRHLAPLVTELPGVEECTFWRLTAEVLTAYQHRHPELHSKFEAYDLFAPQFLRSCLNRLQLKNNRQMVDLSSPTEALQFAGTLDNPIAQFRAIPQ